MLTLQEWRAVVYRGVVLDSTNRDDGPVFTQFRHDARGAIDALRKEGAGVAVAALYHPEIGDIDLRWGYTGDDGRAHGAGLAKLIRWHPEVLHDLQGFISSLSVYQSHKRKGEIHLSDGKNARAGVKLTWNGKTGHWLATAYLKKRVSASKGSSAALDEVLGPTTAPPNDADNVILGFEL